MNKAYATSSDTELAKKALDIMGKICLKVSLSINETLEFLMVLTRSDDGI